MIYRISAGVVLPPLLGAFSLFILLTVKAGLFANAPVSGFSGFWPSNFWPTVPITYVFMGLQSIVYSLLMEFIGQRILTKSGGVAGKSFYVILSVALGVAAGATTSNLRFVSIGAIVGFIVGSVLLLIHKPANEG